MALAGTKPAILVLSAQISNRLPLLAFLLCLGSFYLLIPLPGILSARYPHGLLAIFLKVVLNSPLLDYIFFSPVFITIVLCILVLFIVSTLKCRFHEGSDFVLLFPAVSLALRTVYGTY